MWLCIFNTPRPRPPTTPVASVSPRQSAIVQTLLAYKASRASLLQALHRFTLSFLLLPSLRLRRSFIITISILHFPSLSLVTYSASSGNLNTHTMQRQASSFMRIIATISLLTFFLASLPVSNAAATPKAYKVSQDIKGAGFYDAFEFENIDDPTHGRVYVSQSALPSHSS